MVFGLNKIKRILCFFKSEEYNRKDFGKIGAHTIIKAGSQLVPQNMYLDDYVLIQNGNNFISHKGKLIVKKYSVISSGCIIVPSSHKLKVGVPFFLSAKEHIGDVDSDIIIEEDCWIGAGCILLPNVHIGRGVVVGAGAVVTKNIQPYSVAVGNPAKVIATRYDLDSCLKHEKKIYSIKEQMDEKKLKGLFDQQYNNLKPIGNGSITESDKKIIGQFFQEIKDNE